MLGVLICCLLLHLISLPRTGSCFWPDKNGSCYDQLGLNIVELSHLLSAVSIISSARAGSCLWSARNGSNYDLLGLVSTYGQQRMMVVMISWN